MNERKRRRRGPPVPPPYLIALQERRSEIAAEKAAITERLQRLEQEYARAHEQIASTHAPE
jgi:hypothetical protein